MIPIPRIQHFKFLTRAQNRSIATLYNIIPAGGKLSKPLRRPVRGGQNLSERYKRLEDAIRGKETREFVAKRSTGIGPQKLTSVPTFYGFPVPRAPKPPADDGTFLPPFYSTIFKL